MAQLHRFVKLHDRFDSQIFTFILPSSLVKEFSPDVFSRDFVYGHQKWCISFVKGDKHVSCFLTLKNLSEGMKCSVDYTFTMVNKEHFTKNESFTERGCIFSLDKCTHGRRTFVGISDLCNRNFIHDNGEFLVELELRNMWTTFEQVLQMPKDPKDHQVNARRYQKFETTYFTFGSFDWNLSLFPFGESAESDGRPLVYLTRQTSFDHFCKIRYRILLGHGEKVMESDTVERILDTSGMGEPFEIGYNLYNFTSSKSRLKIKVELISVSAVSQVKIPALNRSKNRAHLYDRDKQAWLLESDIDNEYMKLRLYYSDVHNVPRGYTRYVCWSAFIIPAHGRSRPIRTIGAPYSSYYSQMDGDSGFEMCTDVPVNEINDPDSVYLEETTHKLTVQVEWLDSHLLYHSKYHRLDDVSSQHKHQMWREIMALQAENYALEKQLHSYQQSIARTNARGNFTEDHLVLGD